MPMSLQHISATRAFLDKRKLDSGLARFLRERFDAMDRKCHREMDAAPMQSSAAM
jgi:hypothetical protein